MKVTVKLSFAHRGFGSTLTFPFGGYSLIHSKYSGKLACMLSTKARQQQQKLVFIAKYFNQTIRRLLLRMFIFHVHAMIGYFVRIT